MTQTDSGGHTEQNIPLTDVVLMLYLEEIAQEESTVSGAPAYEANAVKRSANGAFSMGCATGIAFPDLVHSILAQTHPKEDPVALIEECKEPLLEQIVEARTANEEIGAGLFLESLFDAMEEDEYMEAQATYNVLSISFEYGCILASVDRRAALLTRNDFNRKQKELVESIMTGQEPHQVLGTDPSRPIQDTTKELIAAYLSDFGFKESKEQK